MDPLKQDTELIRQLVEFSGLKPAQVAKRAGVAVTTINRPYTATAPSRLGRSVLEKLQAAFPDFPGWSPAIAKEDRSTFAGAAASGSLERLLPREKVDESTRRPSPAIEDDMVEIAEIDLNFGLGGAFMDEHPVPNMRAFSRSWLRQFTDAGPEDLYWAKGKGDSMSPTIEDGEPVLIDRRQQTPRMTDLIWAFAWGEIGAIKRLRPMPDGGLKILSDNTRVPPETAYDGEVHIFGRVVGVAKRL